MPARKKTNKKGKGGVSFWKKLFLNLKSKISSVSLHKITIYFVRLIKTLFLKIKGNKVVQWVVGKTEKPIKLVYQKIENFFVRIAPRPAKAFISRHFPLLLAIIFLMPSFILLYIFISSRLNQKPSHALAWTGAVRVSKQSTTLSAADNTWLKSMAYSGDGANGDGDYFNPVHVREAATDTGQSAAGRDALATVTANNYDAIGGHFIAWRPSSDGNLYGVVLSLHYSLASNLNNYNVVIELLRFPSANYTGTPPSGSWDANTYVTCSAITTCTYPVDTVIERRVIYRWDQTMNVTAAPGSFGHQYLDFRFDPVFAATTTAHYGFRVYYNNLTTAAGWPRNGATKPLLNAANFGLGVLDIDVVDANTVTIPLANSGTMVSLNSAAGFGVYAATVARTQNEHWTGVYDSDNGNWTITGSVSGAQTNKLTTATDGGGGAAYVNDGVAKTTLTAPATASTRLCVADGSVFAVDQNIDIWDTDTAPVTRRISQINIDDDDCSGDDEIIVTAALSANETYTTDKNPTVARSIWKLRIIQGAEEAVTEVLSTTKICVNDATGFSTSATSNNVNLWDNDSAVGANRINPTGGIVLDDLACSNPAHDSITLVSSVANYTVLQGARIAEINVNFSNLGTPDDEDAFRFTVLNMGQNPTKTGTAANLLLYYGRTITPATTATPANYPYLINIRHPFFVAYGDIETTAPVDGDMVIVGGGAADPDASDSTNLSDDTLLATLSPHTVTVDKNFDMPLVYTGATGGGYANGTTTAATASYGGSGFVSMLLTTRSTLAADTTANKHYRLVAPGKVPLASGATLSFGTSSSSLPQTSTVDFYQDSSGPTVSTTLGATISPGATSATMASVDGFYIGDVVQIKDDDTSPIMVLIASINTSTKVVTFVATTNYYPWVSPVPTGYTYTAAKNATVTRGPNTDRPTGAERRSFIYGARGTAARENMNSQGVDTYRTPQANLAVDIDGNIDTGYLGAQQTSAGNTWLDVATSSGTLAGNWSVLDPLAVAQGTNQAVNYWDSSLRMGANDDANYFPTWASSIYAGTAVTGFNAESMYNSELTEIGTVPLTDIYNADYNGGSPLYSSNYQTTSAWTIFGDDANTETGDAVYFGDQGSTPIYALEFNIKTAISAEATRVWEYYNGSSWTTFTPSMAWSYEPRGTDNAGVGEYCIPFSSDPAYPLTTIPVTDANTTYTYFVAGQFVKIKDDDSPTIIRRIITVTTGTPGTLTFSEILPEGYTTGANAKVCVPIGGRWVQTDTSNLFTTIGRFLVSWNSWDIPNVAKTTVNSVSAYWVRNRISVFPPDSWTTSPVNQTTPVSMQGVETTNSAPLTVFNSVQEAKLSQLSTGASFDPNETWVLRYNDNSTAVATLKTTRWYESQLTSYGTAHRWQSPNPDGETSAYYEKNSQETNWRTLNGDFSWTDYSVYAKIYMNQIMSSTRRIGLFLRQDPDDYGYALYITPSDTPGSSSIRWYTTAAGAEAAIGTATTITFNPNQWYCLRAEVKGTTLQSKFWSPATEDADCNGDANEPGGVGSDSDWGESETGQATFTAGRFGLAADTMLVRFDDVTVRNTAYTETWFNDNFNDTGCWQVIGSIHGSQGCAYNSVPFTSGYINFTLKHKGGVQSGETGVNAVLGPLNAPEEGDEIYLSPLMRGSNVGLDEDAGITTSNTYSKYENWDFVYDSLQTKWVATGSAYGDAGTATPGTTFTSPGGEISLKIKSGTPAGAKFGPRAAYLQNSYQRSTGNFTGLNNQNSAILVSPTHIVTGSNTGYNIEGISGTVTNTGTIDFWFKPNFTGSPDYIQYLFDWAANTLTTDRISVRILPTGVMEAVVWGGATRSIVLTKSFTAVAGQWYHFRLAWEDSDSGNLDKKYAYLDGVAFTNNGTAAGVGARGTNAGMLRLGNSWQYNAGFDGAIDEFAVFDNAVDTSSGDDWGDYDTDLPDTPWTNGETAGTLTNTGNIIFLTHFDEAIEEQRGSLWADYFTGHPAIAFTNGADTSTNDRIRVTTYPYRTRVWTDNTGSQYTPSARTKYSEGYALGSETGWMTGFQYHHRAYSASVDQPISSPVLNMRKQIRMWSDEDYIATNRMNPANQGYGIYLYYPKDISLKHLELSQLYEGLYFYGNPYSGSTTYSTQYVQNCSLNNIHNYGAYIASKTQGNLVFDNLNLASNSYYLYGLYSLSSANLTLKNSYMTGYTTYYMIHFNGGRNFTVSGNKFLNTYYPLYLVSGTAGVAPAAKMTISGNEFWRYKRGVSLGGNAFLTFSDNTFDGGVSAETTHGYYGTGFYVTPGTSNVEITDSGSNFGRSIWNEVDISMPEDTTTYLAGSLLSYKAESTKLHSNFQYLGLSSQDKFGNEYISTAIPGVDARIADGKDIFNFTNFGVMRTTGSGLADTMVRTDGGYGWRMESSSKTDALEYTARVVGVSGKTLAVAGYLQLNAHYGTDTLPTVTLSGLGMTGANLTWTAAATTGTWQQFVVSGTPTESALATLTFSIKSTPVVADSGTAENVDDAQGTVFPTMIEDTDKTWTWNQWAGYKMRDDQDFVFDIIGNTANRLFLKGTVIPFGNTLPTQPYGSSYEIYSPPYVYMDDVSVLSGTVDTGTLDFHSQGQPVSPWLATGLTTADIWGAQYSIFSDITGSFGQLIQDALIARYGDVSDPAPTTTTFNTNLPTTTDDFYNDGVIIFTEGQNKGIIRRISDYGGASKTITVDPALPFAPADGDRFAVLAATSASTGGGGASAAEIWSYVTRRLTDENLDSGKLATQADIQGLNNITAASVWAVADKTITGVTTEGAQNIWDTACAILNTSGSVGKQVCGNLDALVSSRSTLTAADVWAETTRTITNMENAALTAIWANGSRTLTNYGNDITAQDVWNVLVSNLTLVDSIGKLLVTNVDDQISEKASQSSLDTHSQAVATTSALVDASVSSRASQSSLDSHENSEASFRTTTTDTLGVMTANIALIKSDLSDIETKIDTITAELATIETKIDAIGTSTDTYNKVVEVSNSLKTVTDRIGKVSVDSFTQLFEVKKTDIDYLKNKTLELKAVLDIDRQLLEKTVNQPVVKVIMEWGSVIIKFIIVNPSDSTTQKIPFKAFLPKEVKQEYVMDLGGLNLNYDTSTEQYYVTADITLKAGEAITRAVEIKDIWVISEDEIASLRKQSEELSNGLKNTSYYAQSLTLKTDVNTRLDKIARKQKENNATPQDHILTYRENQEDMKAVQDNIKGLKELILSSGVGNNFLASIGGIQTFATWGIVLILIFGMGALGSFYYSLWRKKVITVSQGKKNKKGKTIELPTPMPYELPVINFDWLKRIIIGLTFFAKHIFILMTTFYQKITTVPKTVWLILTAIIFFGIFIYGFIYSQNVIKKFSMRSIVAPTVTPKPLSLEEKRIKAAIAERIKKVREEKAKNAAKALTDGVASSGGELKSSFSAQTASIIKIRLKDGTGTINVREKADKGASISAKIKGDKDYLYLSEQGDWYQIEIDVGKGGWVNKEFVEKIEDKKIARKEDQSAVLGSNTQYQQMLVIKQTPTDWLNVREKPSMSAKIITKIYPGESYPFSESQSGWFKILLKDLREGWVSGEYIRIENQKELDKKGYVEIIPPAGSGVNIRENPNQTAKVIKTVYIKNKYSFLTEEKDWVKIELLDGSFGFVAKEFCRIIN